MNTQTLLKLKHSLIIVCHNDTHWYDNSLSTTQILVAFEYSAVFQASQVIAFE